MPKKKDLPENIQKLKTQLESGHNLIDYFLLCGVEPSICLNEDLYDTSNQEYENNLIKNYSKPKILSKFPEFDNINNTIDEEIISYCFPHGFKPTKYDGENLRREIFSIILDNNLCSSDHPQKYLSCLLFYEKITLYKKLEQAIEKLQVNNGIENKSSDDFLISQTRETNVSDRNTAYSDFRMTTNIENNNNNSNNKNNNNNINDTNKSMKRMYTHSKLPSCKIPLFSFCDDNNNDDGKLSINPVANTSRLTKFNQNENSSFSNLRYYYIPKCICLVSIHPYIKLFQQILLAIYQNCLNNPESLSKIPIEKIITNLILEVPTPPRGLYSIEYELYDNRITLENTENNKILITEVDLKKLSNNLNFEHQLNIIKHILLCSKILFFSKNINPLTDTILAFLYLIFPFKYPFQVTSYLNKENYNILESISPFIMGINEKYSESFFTDNGIIIEGTTFLIVDLDGKNCHLFSDEKFPEFPIKPYANLEKEIKNLKSKEENLNKIKFNEEFQNYYFNFFCDLLKNYEDYLNLNYFKSNEEDKVTSTDTLFNIDSFVKSHNANDLDFYQKFVEDSQLFGDFIYKRMIPRNNQEIIELSLVNERTGKNKIKFFEREKRQSTLLNFQDFKITNKYIVSKPREISKEEKNILSKNLLDLAMKGNIINIKSNINDRMSTPLNIPNKKENTAPIYFKYYIFPKLDFNIYCNNENANEYFPPPDYSEEIEAISTDLVSKSSLGQNINRNLEMKNYLYLTWLETWAYCFKYIDVNERHYRFDQMLDVLNKVIHHEINIFNLIFEVLFKEKEDQMILKLYEKILQLKINPSTFIYNIISSVLDKKKIKKILEEIKNNKSKKIKFNDHFGKIFLKRSFLTVSDKLMYSYKIKFCPIYSCISCGNEINMLNLCKKFDKIKNDILWVPCSCGEYNLPKLSVELCMNLNNLKNFNTLTKDEFVLHSPYNLKINIKNAVITHYGNNIDVVGFKTQFKPLFWNFIWYCKILNLDYSIILPYLKDLEKEKQIQYYDTNHEIFNIAFDDEKYRENIKKIEKSSEKIYDEFTNSNNKNKFQNLVLKNEIKIEFILNKEKKEDKKENKESKEKHSDLNSEN